MLIGNVDVKTAAVEFYVQRMDGAVEINQPIRFDIEVLNKGQAVDLNSGIFTAPKSGRYFFSWTGVGHLERPETGPTSYLKLAIQLNDESVGQSFLESTIEQYKTYSIQSTLDLIGNDRVTLVIVDSQSAGLYDDDGHVTHFNGMLIDEDIF